MEIRTRLKGTYTALITPFSEDGKTIDYSSVDALLAYQLAANVDGLVIAGSTGEAATLSDVEYGALIRYIVDRLEAKIPCIAGVNASATSRAVDLALRAVDSGADGLLLVTPPYNKPTQEGVLRHFQAVYSATRAPIIAYNVPGRTAGSLSPATLATLAQESVIVGLKESSGNMDAILDLMLAAPKELAVFSGDDSLTLSVMAHGGAGIVSVASNVAPKSYVALTRAALAGDLPRAASAQMESLPLIRALFAESNPIPLKAALALKGIIKYPTLRLPLTPPTTATIERLKEIFAQRAFE